MNEPYFLTQAPNNDLAAAARLLVQAEYAMYSRFAHEDFSEIDYELTLIQYSQMTGRGKVASEEAIFAYLRLQDLPQLRALQDEHMLLDVKRLAAVNTIVSLLGPSPDPEHLERVDDLLVRIFTPKKPRQELPGPTTITRRLRTLVAQLNPSTAYNKKQRKDREDPDKDETTRVDYYDHHDGQQLKAGMEISTDPVVAETFRMRAEIVAKEENVSRGEAAERLLCGESDPKVVLHGFTPLDEHGNRIEGAPVWLPGLGWTDADGIARIEDWGPEVKPMESAASNVTESYTPTPEMRAFVAARDGVCVYPGCNVEATRCQLDHRIPFEDGGPTTPANLHALCQHHHNIKTDKNAFYLPDPATGEIVWLFADGTYLVREPQGLIDDMVTPTNPRWATTVEQRAANRAKNRAFFAAGHKILDDYRIHRDKQLCEAEIAKLEAEYGKTFGFEPDDLFSPLDRIPELVH